MYHAAYKVEFQPFSVVLTADVFQLFILLNATPAERYQDQRIPGIGFHGILCTYRYLLCTNMKNIYLIGYEVPGILYCCSTGRHVAFPLQVSGRNDSHSSTQNIYNAAQCYSERLVYVLTNSTVAATRKSKITCPSCRTPRARFRLTMPIRANRPKNTRASTVSSPNLLRFFVTTFPAAKKMRSDAADEAEIAKYFLANLARVGYANRCRHHQLKSSSPVLSSSL